VVSRAKLRELTVLHFLCESEINQLEMSLSVYEYVLWLQVPEL
jgi:hypothetical protein